MTKPKIDLEHIVKLANLNLTESEKKTYSSQLSAVLDYVSELKKINADNVEPIGHITGLVNVSRKDEAAPSLSQEDALKNASEVHNGLFQVDSIFQEDE